MHNSFLSHAGGWRKNPYVNPIRGQDHTMQRDRVFQHLSVAQRLAILFVDYTVVGVRLRSGWLACRARHALSCSASSILWSCSAMISNLHVVFGMWAMPWIVVLGNDFCNCMSCSAWLVVLGKEEVACRVRHMIFQLHVVLGMACLARQGRGSMSCSAWEF